MPKKLLIVAIALAVIAVPAFAALVGTMSGSVKDAGGAPLPGVSVTVTGKVLQGSRTTVTKADGTFQFVNLPPGSDYKVTFALSGFKQIERTGLTVALDKDTQVNAALEMAATTEVVVSAEAPAVDVTQTNTQQTFSNEYLKKIPVGLAGRSYQNILGQAPGVSTGAANPSVLGGNLQENSWNIDGVNTTDPITHTFTFNLNYDAIEEIGLQTSSFDAEYGRASGAVINVVTKSGGNEFHGNGDVRYTTNDMSESGDHFDPDLSESQNNTWGVTLGGPVLKDRLWFFGNFQRPDNFTTPFTTNTTILSQNPTPVKRAFKGWNSGLKLTFTGSDMFSGFANIQDSQAEILGSGNSSAIRPEAASTQNQKTRIYTLRANAVFNPSWLGELNVGRHDQELESLPASGTVDISRWVNSQGSVSYDNHNNHQKTQRDRNLFGLSSTLFFDAMGNHQVKIGGDYDQTEGPGFNYTTGTPSDPSFCPAGKVCGATFTFNGFNAQGQRIPTQQVVSERQGAVDRSGKSFAFYAQDQWRFKNLTFHIGVRFDRGDYYNNVDANIIHFTKWQPRLAAAWDIAGDGKTVFRASYGQFYSDPALTLNRLFTDAGTLTPITRTFNWVAAQNRWNLIQQTGGVPGGTTLIDSPVDPTYDDQINVAIQREITRGLSASFTYVYKKTQDIYEDTCINQSECPDFWLSNRPGYDVTNPLPNAPVGKDALFKDYYGYMFQTQYQFHRGLVNANYTYSKYRGTIDSSGGQYAGVDFDLYPSNFVYRYGYLADDARHRIKVYGNYRIPWIETDFSLGWDYRSGLAYTVTGTTPDGSGTNGTFLEPRGSRRTAPLYQVDAELKKTFNIFGSVSITPIFSVFNLFDTETITGAGYFTSFDSNALASRPGCGDASGNVLRRPPCATTWGVTNGTYQRPRNYQVGLRVEF